MNVILQRFPKNHAILFVMSSKRKPIYYTTIFWLSIYKYVTQTIAKSFILICFGKISLIMIAILHRERKYAYT